MSQFDRSRNKRAFTLIETMVFGTILVGGALALSSLQFAQKKQESSQQNILVGRKILAEQMSRVQSQPSKYPYVVAIDTNLVSSAGIAGLRNVLKMSFVNCFDRTGNLVAGTRNSQESTVTAIDNRIVTRDSSCIPTSSSTGMGFTLGGALGGGAALGGSSGCSVASILESFKASGFCNATTAEFESQVTPTDKPGHYDVWVVSLIPENKKSQRGILRQFFREQLRVDSVF